VKKGAVFLLLAGGIVSYAQNDHHQGDQNGRPAVESFGRGEIRPHAWIRTFGGRDANQAATAVLAPSQITAAYGINAVPGLGQGATVVIVDAYDSPNVASDLAAFSSEFGISCSTGGGKFTKVNQSGSATPLPGENSGWEVEINLDTQWVHAVAPCANIVLVEANSSADSDLMTAVNTAAKMGSVVSMSWGGSESFSQTSYDSFFVKGGVTFLASSGDTGGEISWPASSPNVIAVGGTNLTLNSNGTVAFETGWSGSGGGCSAVEPAIAAQAGFVPTTCRNRATPDVAMDGGSGSPVYVYISDQGGWYAVYGTSLSVQLWAGVTALANGLRSTPLNGTLGDLYADAAGAPTSALYIDNYRDITSGQAGSFSAAPGWDFVTGLGSPLVSSLVPLYLAKQSLGADFNLSSSPGSQTVVQGNATSFTASVTPLNGFNSSVSLGVSGLPSGAKATFNPASVTGGGSSAMSVTTGATTPAGTYPLTITGTSGSLVHTTTVTLVVRAAASSANFSISASPVSRTVSPGSETTYAVTVTSSGGFAGKVNLSISGLPFGTYASVAALNGSGSATLYVITNWRTPAGTYTLTIQGASGSLSHSTTVTLIVL